MDDLKLAILKTSRDIKRKYIALRKGEQEEEEQTRKLLKPITQPFGEIVRQTAQPRTHVKVSAPSPL